jgi:hypothetical protein
MAANEAWRERQGAEAAQTSLPAVKRGPYQVGKVNYSTVFSTGKPTEKTATSHKL